MKTNNMFPFACIIISWFFMSSPLYALPLYTPNDDKNNNPRTKLSLHKYGSETELKFYNGESNLNPTEMHNSSTLVLENSNLVIKNNDLGPFLQALQKKSYKAHNQLSGNTSDTGRWFSSDTQPTLQGLYSWDQPTIRTAPFPLGQTEGSLDKIVYKLDRMERKFNTLMWNIFGGLCESKE